MTLFAILICVVLQRYFGLSGIVHSTPWVGSYTRSMHSLFGKSSIGTGLGGLALVVLPLVIIVALIDFFLHGWFFNFFSFVFGAIILFYCLDVRNFPEQLKNFFNAYQQRSEQAAFRYGTEFLGDDSAQDLVVLTRAITLKIFHHADHYIFSVLFWYVVLGPTGAILYFTIHYLARKQKADESLAGLTKAASQVQALLDWIPVRLLGFTYALVGHFGYAFAYWWKHVTDGLDKTEEFSYGAGLSALELDDSDIAYADIEENQMALALIDRAIVLWIVVVAVFTLGAWIS